jgi:hypothetical protein
MERLEARGGKLSAREAQQEQQAGEKRRRSGREGPGARDSGNEKAAHPEKSSANERHAQATPDAGDPAGIIARAMQPSHARGDAPPWYVDVLVLIACIAGAFYGALSLGQDANWDLQNYHFYNPWAWLNGRILDRDIAAAQLQTFHNPLPDVPFYALATAGVEPRLITLWLALPTGIAAYFVIRIAWLMFADLGVLQRVGATAAAIAIGFTGAVGVGQLGSTTDEWLVTAFVTASLWLVVREATDERMRPVPLLAAGVLAGVASGLKLTGATYALAICIALALRTLPSRADVRAALLYALGVAGGLLLALGPWALALWQHFGNPLFPYGNRWFHSPWWDAQPAFPNRFGPHSTREWLSLPFKLLAPRPGFVSEITYVDARMPVMFVLGLTIAGGALLARAWGTSTRSHTAFRTSAPRWKLVAIVFVASFVVWAVVHSILRYAIPLEILTGLLIVGALGYLLTPPYATIGVACAVWAMLSTTVASEWGRVPFGRTWFDVRVPPIDRNALVLLTVDAPMSYVLPFFPADARHVGIRNNVNAPGRRNRLAESVENVVREHVGPLYSLSFPKGEGEADLRALGLRRASGGCTEVRTNMPTTPIELCRLERIGAAS